MKNKVKRPMLAIEKSSVHDLAFKRATECGIRWGFGETRIASLTATLVAMYIEGFDAGEKAAASRHTNQVSDCEPKTDR